MQITVERINPPKPGKRNATAFCGSTAYSYNPKEITLSVGNTYELETKSSTNPDVRFVESAVRVDSAPRTDTHQTVGKDRFWLNFCSNTVGQAIASGAIKDASQILIWAMAAKRAMVAVDASAADEDIMP